MTIEIVLFTRSNDILSSIENQWSSRVPKMYRQQDNLAFEWGGDAFWIWRNDNGLVEYEADEVALIQKLMPYPRSVYFISCTSFDSLRDFMREAALPDDLIVDDNAGRIEPLGVFLSRMAGYNGDIPMANNDDPY